MNLVWKYPKQTIWKSFHPLRCLGLFSRNEPKGAHWYAESKIIWIIYDCVKVKKQQNLPKQVQIVKEAYVCIYHTLKSSHFWPDSQWPKTVKNIMMSLKSPAGIDLQLVRCLSATMTIIFSPRSGLSEASDLCVEEMNHGAGANRWRERDVVWSGERSELETGLPVEPLAAGFAAPARGVHLQARPLVLTIHRIEPHRSGHCINIVGVFGKLTVTWMLKLWARKCFKGRRENKTCEVAVIFLEISWAV